MSESELIGSIGVAILLLAFFMNLSGILAPNSRAYQAANALGAGISCYASWLIGFRPFVVLEATWCFVALAALARGFAPRAAVLDPSLRLVRAIRTFFARIA